jgi:hypothetical protein
VYRIFIVLAVLIALAGGAYLCWTTTPLYSFQQAGLAVKSHNLAQFKEYVDVESVVGNLLDDLLFRPIARTPGRRYLGKKSNQAGAYSTD